MIFLTKLSKDDTNDFFLIIFYNFRHEYYISNCIVPKNNYIFMDHSVVFLKMHALWNTQITLIGISVI